jgi:CCR4-NOT transcription complex subunit 2
MDLVKDIKKMFYVCFRDKLAPVKLNRYKDDLLFYMFYTNVGDVLQLAAAAEL